MVHGLSLVGGLGMLLGWWVWKLLVGVFVSVVATFYMATWHALVMGLGMWDSASP